ncbi:ABC transporter substrate-binding protein [Paenibacillus oleatilyticus]|uniref:ABC transporter substrate-binding protein n=1 Tax=Paenibacillus oleatilyticus TaxID=2594886 RepID=A0ABV4UUA6_9BACL
MKKLKAFVPVAFLTASLVACQNGGNNGAAGSADGGGQSKPSDASLNLSMALMGGAKTPNSWTEKALEEDLTKALGKPVALESVFLPGWEDAQTKINLNMSDKSTMPDIQWWYGMDKEYTNWVKSGALVDLVPYLQKNGKTILNYYSPETMFYSYEKGKMYRLPGDVAEATSMTTIIRKDWLDKLGLKVPTTVDEYIEVLRAFTKKDPDGNGKDDTYGLSGPGIAGSAEYRTFAPIFFAYKSIPNEFMVQPDGTVKYGAVLPQTKEALKVLQSMYKEGLIDPRTISNTDANKFEEIAASGKVGSFYRWIAYFNPSSTLYKSFKANNPSGELLAIPPIKGPDGFSSDYPEAVGGWCFIGVTSKAKDPAGAVQALNRIASPETFKLVSFGKEGEHYKMENGQFQSLLTPDELNKLGIGNYTWYLSRKDEANISNIPQVIDLFKKGETTSKPLRELVVRFKTNDRPAFKEYIKDIEKVRDEVFYGIISGKKSIDEFDKFVDKYYAMGGKKVEEEANALYKAQKQEYAEFLTWYDKEIKPYK